MTAPGDLIVLVQGISWGPPGADPDEIPGVTGWLQMTRRTTVGRVRRTPVS